MLNQNIVGPIAPASPNALVPGRAGQLGDSIVSQLHGRYYETNYRGNLYFGGHTGPTALSANTITLTATTTPILGVWNPTTSGVNLVMLQAMLSVFANNLTSGAGPGAFVWAASVGNAGITTGLLPWNAKTLVPSGSQARFFAGATALTGLTTSLTLMAASRFPTPTALTYTTLGSTALLNCYDGEEDFDGSIIVPPGGVLALLNTTSSTAFSTYGRLSWEEVPV